MKKRKAKKRVVAIVEPKPEFAYVVTDKTFGELKIKNSDNAWWLDMTKVELLINAFKYDATHEEACISAGILIHNLRYFMELHPEFSLVIEACRQVPTLKARQTVVTGLGTDLTTARWYLERKRPGEFGVKPPVVAVQINMNERIDKIREKFKTE